VRTAARGSLAGDKTLAGDRYAQVASLWLL